MTKEVCADGIYMVTLVALATALTFDKHTRWTGAGDIFVGCFDRLHTRHPDFLLQVFFFFFGGGGKNDTVGDILINW